MYTFSAVILPPLIVAVRDASLTFVGSTSEVEDTYSLLAVDRATLEDCCIGLDALDGTGLVLIILEGVAGLELIILEGVGISVVDMSMEVLLEVIVVVLINEGDVDDGTGREVELTPLKAKIISSR